MKCPNCGETSRIREKDRFCHKCGHQLKNEKNVVKGKIILEGGKEYLEKMSEIRSSIEATKDEAKMAARYVEQLNNSLEKLIELRERLR